MVVNWHRLLLLMTLCLKCVGNLVLMGFTRRLPSLLPLPANHQSLLRSRKVTSDISPLILLPFRVFFPLSVAAKIYDHTNGFCKVCQSVCWPWEVTSLEPHCCSAEALFSLGSLHLQWILYAVVKKLTHSRLVSDVNRNDVHDLKCSVAREREFSDEDDTNNWTLLSTLLCDGIRLIKSSMEMYLDNTGPGHDGPYLRLDNTGPGHDGPSLGLEIERPNPSFIYVHFPALRSGPSFSKSVFQLLGRAVSMKIMKQTILCVCVMCAVMVQTSRRRTSLQRYEDNHSLLTNLNTVKLMSLTPILNNCRLNTVRYISYASEVIRHAGAI